MKTNLLYSALVTLMLLSTACSKGMNATPSVEPAVTPTTSSATGCLNCQGFVAGATVFSGTLANSTSRMEGVQIVADQNSLATAAQNTSNPKTLGNYQALVTAGTFTAAGAACLPDGTYKMEGFQVGTLSPSLTVQSNNPLWVTLTGPKLARATLYLSFVDSNGDDTADAGTAAYLWVDCNGQWTRVDLSAP